MNRKEIKVVNEMNAKGWDYFCSVNKNINGKWNEVFMFHNNHGEVHEVIVK